MKKIFCSLFLALPLFLSAGDTGMIYKFWVEFTDKNNSPYSIDRPEEFLSQKAIIRRQNQNISITSQDFPVNPEYLQKLSETGVRVWYGSRWLNAAVVETGDSAMASELIKLDFVSNIRLLYRANRPAQSTHKSASTLVERLMTMGAKEKTEYNEGYGFAYEQIQQLNGLVLHKKGLTGNGKTIAVLDAGFYKANEVKAFDLMREQNRLLGTIDFVQGDSMVYDDDLHGLNVLSCMAAQMDGKMIGTAPQASYWLLRTEDNFSEFPIEEANWVRGAEFADSAGADIINSSLGYTSFDLASLNHEYKNLNGKSIASRAATICAHKGMIVCNAAGNEGNDEWKFIGVPADADSIITVGGVDVNGNHVDFSSMGPTSDGRIKPTVTARALQTTVVSSFGKFYPSQGTSFASPVLCGMVACLWQAAPEKTNMEVIEAIKKSGNNYFNPDNINGYGIPDFQLALRILGKDSAFDYNTERLLEPIPEKAADFVWLKFYSPQAQDITVQIKNHRGKVLKTYSWPSGEKDFIFKKIESIPRSRKNISIEIITNRNHYTYKLVTM